MIREAKRLAQRLSYKVGRGRTLREITDKPADLGHLSPSGRPYLPGSIKNMLAK